MPPSTAKVLPPVDSQTEHPRVLLVDDDATLLRSFARSLKHAGFDVITADSAEAAYESFHQGRVDVIVSDISMPHTSGVEMMDTLRQEDEDLPVVLMTGRPSVESAIRAMDSGAMRYLLKPVDRDELVSVVSSAVRRRRNLTTTTSRAN